MYSERKYHQILPILDDELLQRVIIVINDTRSQDISLKKLFGILKSHFPMLVSEQIHFALMQSRKIQET